MIIESMKNGEEKMKFVVVWLRVKKGRDFGRV